MVDLVGAQCGPVIGLHPQADASLHQHAMDCVPPGRYRAM